MALGTGRNGALRPVVGTSHLRSLRKNILANMPTNKSTLEAINSYGNTDVQKDALGRIRVRLYKTDIVVADGDYVLLNTGGHLSYTTKRRMNEVLMALGIELRVAQEDGDWTVYHLDGTPAASFHGPTGPNGHMHMQREVIVPIIGERQA